ncbi:MAG: tetratricopeptide repeat protein [Isosphaeraceae bacterium]
MIGTQPFLSVSRALGLAIDHHRSGLLHEAEAIYRRILEVDPHHADAWHLLGVLAYQAGQHGAGLECIRRALAYRPDWAEAHYNLGIAREHQGRLDDAETCYRRALQSRPDYPEANYNLGGVLKGQGKLDEAAVCYSRVVESRPDHAPAAYNLGRIWQAQGKLEHAAAAYERALELNPSFIEALNDLGNVFKLQGKLDQAEACYRRALAWKPDYALAHYNLGLACQDQGKLDDAVASYQRALELSTRPGLLVGSAVRTDPQPRPTVRTADPTSEIQEAKESVALCLEPGSAEIHNCLASALKLQGKLEAAAASYRQAIQLRPDYAAAHCNLGVVYQELGQFDQAVACCEHALELQPDYATAHYNLATLWKDQGKLAEAEAGYRRALQSQPDYVLAHYNLGIVCQSLGKLDEAIACYQQALQQQPDLPEAHNNLGTVYHELGQLDAARACYQRALELRSDDALAQNNLGNVLKDQGQLDDAEAYYRRALERQPGFSGLHSNLLLTHQYRFGATLAELAALHAEFDRLHAAPLGIAPSFEDHDRNPHRPLRLGFVSADLGRHPVGAFLIRVLENLDRGSCETVCYSDRLLKDELTERFQSAATCWRDVNALSDQRLTEQIVRDRIDILFDLAGHTAHNRLLVFARKPAPIQVTWAGYVGTTGLKTMDYILADRHQIPPGAEAHYSEKVLRMPDGYVTYDPPAYAPPVSPLPALTQGHVVFGSFNNRAKIDFRTVQLWATILDQVPNSRLVLKSKGMSDRSNVMGLLEQFARHNIKAERLELLDRSPHPHLLAEYGRIDLALDPLPYNGGLTTCEALWMGVPVLTCPGETFASRHSLSHLSTAGLKETIARTPEEYVELAASLAGDPPRLAALRTGLRERMAASPLCDGPRFAANLMQLLRRTWQEWCGEGGSAGSRSAS